jgi:phosphomevalonate kinase
LHLRSDSDESLIGSYVHKREINVVLISGKRLSGKDTAGRVIRECVSTTAGRMCDIMTANFADSLKNEYAKRENIDRERLFTDAQFKESHRPGLIRFGEEKRAIDQNYFVNALLDSMDLSNKLNDAVVVICDLRFQNELWATLSYFERPEFAAFVPSFVIVRIEANEETRASRGWTFKSGVDDDASETSLDNIEAIIPKRAREYLVTIENNFSSLPEYEQRVKETAVHWIKKAMNK